MPGAGRSEARPIAPLLSSKLGVAAADEALQLVEPRLRSDLVESGEHLGSRQFTARAQSLEYIRQIDLRAGWNLALDAGTGERREAIVDVVHPLPQLRHGEFVVNLQLAGLEDDVALIPTAAVLENGHQGRLAAFEKPRPYGVKIRQQVGIAI